MEEKLSVKICFENDFMKTGVVFLEQPKKLSKNRLRLLAVDPKNLELRKLLSA